MSFENANTNLRLDDLRTYIEMNSELLGVLPILTVLMITNSRLEVLLADYNPSSQTPEKNSELKQTVLQEKYCTQALATAHGLKMRESIAIVYQNGERMNFPREEERTPSVPYFYRQIDPNSSRKILNTINQVETKPNQDKDQNNIRTLNVYYCALCLVNKYSLYSDQYQFKLVHPMVFNPNYIYPEFRPSDLFDSL